MKLNLNFVIAASGLMGVLVAPADGRNLCGIDRVEKHSEGIALYFEADRRYIVNVSSGRKLEIYKGVVTETSYANNTVVRGNPTEGPIYLLPGQKVSHSTSAHDACEMTVSSDTARPGLLAKAFNSAPGVPGPPRTAEKFFPAN